MSMRLCVIRVADAMPSCCCNKTQRSTAQPLEVISVPHAHGSGLSVSPAWKLVDVNIGLERSDRNSKPGHSGRPSGRLRVVVARDI